MLEVLEARVLYSADSVASLLPLLLPDEADFTDSLGSSLFNDSQNSFDEDDLLPELSADTASVKHVVFIDSAVPDIENLKSAAAGEFTQIVVVESDENGVHAISQSLEQYTSLDSVQLISHGASGQLYLGNQLIDEQVLVDESEALQSWSNAMSDGGDILLLGCDVAAGERGESFVRQLALRTGMDVAASDDLTGSANASTDWDLEFSSGAIEAVIHLDSEIRSNWSHSLGNIDVDTTTDKFDSAILDTWGIGDLITYRSDNNGFEVSLREALYVVQNDQNDADVDTITLPGGVFTLTLTSGNAEGKWGDLNVSADTTIVGEGGDTNPTTINQNVANQRIFTADNATLQLENITISNADTSLVSGGGAIYSTGSVVLTDSVLQNNSSEANGGAIATLGDLTLLRTQVINNSSDVMGGALYAQGDVTIDESVFSGNSSLDDGGAVFVNGGTLTIRDSGFTANFTDSVDGSGVVGNGGAIAGTANIEIHRSSFDNNETRNVNLLSRGGAVYHEGSGSISASDVTFSANFSVLGGAIYTDQSGSISNATFVDNSAVLNGAAIQSEGMAVTIGSSIFSGNDFIQPADSGSSLVVTDPQAVLEGNVVSEGFNLFDFDPALEIAQQASDLVNTVAGSVDSQLNALSGLAGSVVKVHSLNADSQAINAGRVSAPGDEDAHGLRRDQVADIGASEYNSASSIVYWTDSAGSIFRSDVQFSNVQQILSGVTNPGSITVDESASKMYWLSNGDGNSNDSFDLMSASLDGITGETTLLSNLVAASSLALNSATGHLYVAYSGNTQANPSRIDRYDLQNIATQATTVVENATGYNTTIDSAAIIQNPVDVAFSPSTGQLFWAEQGDGITSASIRVLDFSANSIETVESAANSIALNPESTSLFFTDSETDTISELDFDTSQLTQTPVATADAGPVGISYAKTEDQLVWISDEASSITTIDAEDKTSQGRYVHGSALQDVATMRTTTITAIPEIVNNSPMTVPEGAGRLLPKTNLIATDSDTDVADIVYTVTRAPLHGFLSISGNPVSSFTQQDLDGDLVNYLHDGSETLADQIELQLSDGINSSDRFKYDIQINAVNDAPTLRVGTDAIGSPLRMPLQESGTYVLDPSVLVGNDAESAPSELVYRLLSEVSAGSFTVEGLVATSFTGSQLAAGQVRFEHDGSENLPDSLEFLLDDGSDTDSESATVTLAFNYTPVNDLPRLTTTAVSVFENGSVEITNQNLIVADPDLGFGSMVYSLAELPVSHGTVEVQGRGPLLSTAMTFTQVELNSGLVSYTPNVNNAQDTTYQLVFVATDPEGGSSEPASMDIVVSGVNNTPTLATSPLVVDEGSEIVLTDANFVVNDPDSPSQDWVLSFRDTEQMNGRISIYNQSEEWVDDEFRYFSYQDLLAGNVFYTHDGGEADSAQINFRVGDGITTSQEVALQIAVTPVNDVPSLRISNNSISVEEGGQYIFQSSDFSFTDADARPEDIRLFFGVADDVSGAITVGGERVNSFSLADLEQGRVVYTHDGSEPELTGTNDKFTVRMSDGESQSSQLVLSVGIESQNDLPEFSFLAASDPILENKPGLIIGEISYTDTDAGDTVEFSVNDDRFVLTPLSGNTVQLALGEASSLDFENDTDNATGEMKIEIVAIDTHSEVQRPADYQGVKQQAILTVVDVNDVPVINVPAVLTGVSGADYTFESSWVVDQDDSLDTLVFTASQADGSDLPSWLEFNAQTRQFVVVAPESKELSDINVIIRIADASGETSSVPVLLLFDVLTDPAPATPVEGPDDNEAPAKEPEQIDVVEINVEPSVEPRPEPTPASVSVSEQIVEAKTEADTESDAKSKDHNVDETLDAQLNEQVDLHDLIQPLASIGNLQLAVIDSEVRTSQGSSGGSKSSQDLDVQDLNSFFNATQSGLEAELALMSASMDSKELDNEERAAATRAFFGTSTGISTGLSVGYLLWLVRGGTLMGSVLSSLPAWRFVDPLPVLGSLADDMEDDEESLASIVDNKGRSEVDPALPAAPTLATRLARLCGWKR